MRLRSKPEPVDVAHDATELIVLEGFRPRGSRMIERGERFPRDLDLAKAYPEYFGLLLPLSQLQEVNHGEQKAGAPVLPASPSADGRHVVPGSPVTREEKGLA
jgi:hypothetical protein